MCPLGQEGKSNRTFRRGSDLNEAPHLILPQIAAERSFWARRQTWGEVWGSGRLKPSRAVGVIDMLTAPGIQEASGQHLVEGTLERIDTATNGAPGLTKIATIHSTVHTPRVSVGNSLCSIDVNCKTA